MKSLTYKQLAFILDIEPIEAARKIIFVHCKLKGLSHPIKSNLIRDYYYKDSTWPKEMGIAELSTHLNLPDLQMAVDDIRNNYLTRQASKKYILCDYPEKELKTKLVTQVKLPPVLTSLLKDEDVNFIESEWNRRYGITF
jgi:hypothetical protein